MKIKLADKNLLTDSIVDGEGLRTVIWTQGCSHNCKGCHNPETHDFNAGFEVDTTYIKEQLNKLNNQDGITISGGDPFFQPEACTEIAEYAKSLGLNVWVYTGFNYEDLLSNPKAMKALNFIDVLVDGKFVLELKSYDVKFRGSSNQRIINVPRSLKERRVCIIKKYDQKLKNKVKIKNCLFI